MPTKSTVKDGVRITELGDGLVGFILENTDKPTPETTVNLHNRIQGYILTRRGMKVVATLPMTSQGETISVMFWTEGAPDV